MRGDASHADERRIPSSRSTGSCSPRRVSGAEEARASAAAFLAGAADARVEVHGFRDGFLPYVGGEVKDVFEELKDQRRPAGRLHARGLRLPPGPSTRVRADVEHVPPPPDPRVRDPEGGRRPRPAERLLPAEPGRRRAEARAARTALPEPGRQALVRPGDIPGPDAAARDGSGRGRSLCRGVHRRKAVLAS